MGAGEWDFLKEGAPCSQRIPIAVGVVETRDGSVG